MVDNPRKVFAIRLRLLRESISLSQAQLAKELKISSQSVSCYESEDRFPAVELLVKFAKYFHVSTDWFLGVENKLPAEYISVFKLRDREAKVLLRAVDKLHQIILSSTLD